MELKSVRAFVEATKLGSTVSYYTNLDLDGVIERVRIVGKIKEKYSVPEMITVVPENIVILEKEKETPYQGKFPKTIDSILEEINGYTVLRED